MKTQATIAKWGNSEGIRIPREIREATGLHEGMTVTIETHDNSILIQPQTEPVRKLGRYTLVNLDKLFENYHGPQPTENGFEKPVGEEHL